MGRVAEVAQHFIEGLPDGRRQGFHTVLHGVAAAGHHVRAELGLGIEAAVHGQLAAGAAVQQIAHQGSGAHVESRHGEKFTVCGGCGVGHGNAAGENAVFAVAGEDGGHVAAHHQLTGGQQLVAGHRTAGHGQMVPSGGDAYQTFAAGAPAAAGGVGLQSGGNGRRQHRGSGGDGDGDGVLGKGHTIPLLIQNGIPPLQISQWRCSLTTIVLRETGRCNHHPSEGGNGNVIKYV